MARNSVHMIIGITMLSAACSNSDRGNSTHAFRIYKESGVTISETTGGAKYPIELFKYEEVARLKEDESVEESLLSRPIWMLMDEQGQIYVLDLAGGRNGRILVYTNNGDFSHTIGQIGEGPGKFQLPQIMSTQGNEITVYDLRLNRISIFSSAGIFQNLITLPRGQSGIPNRATLDSDGNIIMIYQVMDQSQEEFRHIAWNAVILTASGDTLGEVVTPKTISGHRVFQDGRSFQAPAYFTGFAQIDFVSNDYFIVTDGVEPAIKWYASNGKLTREYRLPIEADNVTDGDRVSVNAYYNQQIEGAESEGEREYHRRAQSNVYYPEQKAHWEGFYYEDNGFLWLKYQAPFAELDIYRVLSPDGEYLGDSTTPSAGGYISHGHYLVISEDEETGEYLLIVYQIHPVVSGLSYPD